MFQSEDAMSWPLWVEYLTNISHLTTTINSSVNFYIYIAKHRHKQRTATLALVEVRVKPQVRGL